ncbi:MAG TPA: hypothetical protein PLK30_17485 [Blastocatellia bacterium]|nr:hypothetical protein [Blastocatellia bacterium]
MTTIQRRFEERTSAVWSSARRQQQSGWQAPVLRSFNQVQVLVYLLAGKLAATIYPAVPILKQRTFGAIGVLELLPSESRKVRY